MPTPLPIDVRERIAKLIPSLSHIHAGEVAATAAAIAQVLKRAGADWHDLAHAIFISVPAGPSISERAQAGMRERPSQYADQIRPGGFGARKAGQGNHEYAARTQAEHRHRKSPAKGEVSSAELVTVIGDIERAQGGYLDGLGERAHTFLEQLRTRSEKYDTVLVSFKQDRWLRTMAKDNGVDVPWAEIEDQEAA